MNFGKECLARAGNRTVNWCVSKSMRIPSAVSQRISKPLLDLVENLPAFSGGIIKHLQEQRKRQRKYAADWQQQSALPEGTNLRFRLFRLLELYTADEIGSVVARIEKVIPPHWGSDDYLSWIDSPSFLGGGFKSLGILSPWDPRKERAATPGEGYWSLPQDVRSVHFTAHQILPSAYLITADVFLTDAAEQTFRDLRSAPHLPEVTLGSIQRIPQLSHWFLGTGQTSPRHEQRKALNAWLMKLRCQTEGALEPFFRGHFSRDTRSAGGALPVIEVIWLEGAPRSESEFVQWAQKARLFFSSIGEDVFSWGAFKSDDKAVSIRPGGAGLRKTQWRIYMLQPAKPDLGDICEARELCDALEDWTVLFSFAESLDRRLHRLQTLASRGRRDWGLRRYFRLYADLIDDYTLFTRLKADAKGLRKSLASRQLEAFQRISAGAGEKPARLNSVLSDSVKRYFRALKIQAEATMNSTKEYLGLSNMRVMYVLQIAVLIITALSAVFAYRAARQALRDRTPAQVAR